MIRNFICLVVIAFLTQNSLLAQQRSCNLAVTLVSPAEDAVIPSMASFDVVVNIQNNGADSLKTGDTLYYHSPLMFAFDYYPVILSQGIAPGAMAVLTIESILNENENIADEEIDFCVEIRHHLLDEGTFTDEDLSDNVGCNHITLEPTLPSSISEQGTQQRIQPYPNPASTHIYFQLSQPQKEAVQARLLDMNGRQLQSSVFKDVQAGQRLSVDISSLPAGTYMLELINGSQRATGIFSRQ